MLLSSNTLVNLYVLAVLVAAWRGLISSEIYRNQTDGGIYGSLLWRELPDSRNSTTAEADQAVLDE